MANILKKVARFYCTAEERPVTKFYDGDGIDVFSLGTGHIGCGNCGGVFFGARGNSQERRVEIGCDACGWEGRLVFPLGTKHILDGSFRCEKHGNAAALIKSDTMFCIGCRTCKKEVLIELPYGSPLIV